MQLQSEGRELKGAGFVAIYTDDNSLEGLIQTIPAVFGYNRRYYTGLSSKDTIVNLLLTHYHDRLHTVGFQRWGKCWEAESTPHYFFKPKQLVTDQTSNNPSAGILWHLR